MPTVRVQTEDFDTGRELDALTRGRTNVGALASFTGLVRDANDGTRVSAMTLEHYPAMTQKALEDICAQAHSRWDLIDTLVIHRVGALQPGDRIVLVGVTSAHRGDASVLEARGHARRLALGRGARRRRRGRAALEIRGPK